jgi:hypothetical protein
MKLKSVEFLMQQLFDPSWKEGIEIQNKWFKTAKDMHKNEIKNAYNQGKYDTEDIERGGMPNFLTFEDYYNETFNTKDNGKMD